MAVPEESQRHRDTEAQRVHRVIFELVLPPFATLELIVVGEQSRAPF
jgi:hypothetical protein